MQAAHKSAEARYEKASDAEEQLLVRVQELTAEKEAVSSDPYVPTSLPVHTPHPGACGSVHFPAPVCVVTG